MRTIKFKRVLAEVLEAAGQLRLPYIDELKELTRPIVQLVRDVKAAVAAKINVTAKSISVRLQHFLLTISGEDREVFDDDVGEIIASAGSESDAVDALVGVGFCVRGEFA
jgi:hypothetical protein